MKSDYTVLLSAMCDGVSQQLSCGRCTFKMHGIFNEICIKLRNDFLPPVEREDIAAIAFDLLCVYANAQRNGVADNFSIETMNNVKKAIEELVAKRKTCGESVRRLVENQTRENRGADILESLVKTVYIAYFRNL